jgi:hypothetical protein
VDGQKRQRRKNFRYLRSEYWRMHDNIASRSIGNDFTFSKHNASISNRGNNLDIVCCDNDCVAISCKLRQNLD